MLFLTVNNYSNISKRVRFLFFGSLTNKTNEGRFVQTIDVPAAGVRQALFFPQIRHSLEQAVLEIETVKSTRGRFGTLLLTPLALLIRLVTMALPLHKKESNLNTAVERGCRVQLLGLNAFVQKRGLTRWVS